MPPFRSTALEQTPEFVEVTGFHRFTGELEHGHGTCLSPSSFKFFVRIARLRRAFDRVYTACMRGYECQCVFIRSRRVASTLVERVCARQSEVSIQYQSGTSEAR
jgi:hypothetical protein